MAEEEVTEERMMSGRIERFEDLVAWQKSRELNKEVYSVTMSAAFSRDFSLRDQVRRCSVSMMANVAEGFERGRPTEFKQFLSVAKGSCGELRSHLYVALDVGYINKDVFDALYAQASEVARIIGGLRAAVERRCKAMNSRE